MVVYFHIVTTKKMLGGKSMPNKISVVIADDNTEFAEILKNFLNSKGDIDVCGIAPDGEKAVSLIVEKKPDVVLLDIIMPHLDGIGVLERLNLLKERINTTVIVLSAIGQDTITQKSIMLGAEYYMVKPFDLELLYKRIKEVKQGMQETQNKVIVGKNSNIEHNLKM